MHTFTLDQQGRNGNTVYMLYKIQPTGPARRLATQQVEYYQMFKENEPWPHELQPDSHYDSLVGAR